MSTTAHQRAINKEQEDREWLPKFKPLRDQLWAVRSAAYKTGYPIIMSDFGAPYYPSPLSIKERCLKMERQIKKYSRFLESNTKPKRRWFN